VRRVFLNLLKVVEMERMEGIVTRVEDEGASPLNTSTAVRAYDGFRICDQSYKGAMTPFCGF
jgi:hypothetical protein